MGAELGCGIYHPTPPPHPTTLAVFCGLGVEGVGTVMLYGNGNAKYIIKLSATFLSRLASMTFLITSFLAGWWVAYSVGH